MVSEVSVLGSVELGPMVRTSWWQEHVAEATHFIMDRKQRKRVARTRCRLPNMPPVTYFLQLGPTT
jgi:hypothetical protein